MVCIYLFIHIYVDMITLPVKLGHQFGYAFLPFERHGRLRTTWWPPTKKSMCLGCYGAMWNTVTWCGPCGTMRND